MKKHLLIFALLMLISGAMFAQYHITVTSEPDEGGSPYTSDALGYPQADFNYGDQCTLHAHTNVGYTFVNWTAGPAIVNDSVYSFVVTQDSSFVATFTQTDYAIEYTNGGHGTCSGPATAHYNDTVLVTVEPESGYELNTLTYNGTDVPLVNNEYKFAMPASNVTVNATFSQTNYDITYSPNSSNPSNGCYISGVAAAHYNDEITVSVTLGTGYELATLTYNGIDIPFVNGEYKFSMPASDVTVNASFMQTNYDITYSPGSSNPSNGCYISGVATAHYDDVVTVSVTLGTGYELNTLTYTPNGGTPTNITSTMQFPMPANAVAVHATFIQTHIITVSANPTSGGSAYIGDDHEQTQDTITHGERCTVHAEPIQGYTFANWKENNQVVPGASADYTFQVTNDRNLIAYFTQQQYSITVLASPPEGGTVTGNGTYYYGDQINISATANDNYEFVSWGDGFTDNPRQITVTGNATYIAIFSQAGVTEYLVTANVTPENSGTVAGAGSYPEGDTCTLMASANDGYEFVQWKKGNTQVSTIPNYSFMVNTNTAGTYTAYFQPTQYTITANANNPAWGSVSGGGTYPTGAACTLTATPASGYEFVQWKKGNNVVSTNTTYSFTVNASTAGTYTAYFQQAAPTEYTITTEVTPPGSGTVTGGGTYPVGSTITLMAIPNANGEYTFVHWQDGNTDNPRTITVNGNATYTATFEKAKYTITVNSNNEDWGTVSGGGTYEYGQIVTLQATPKPSYEFQGWDDGNNDNPRQITVTGNATYTAFFQPEGTTTYYIGADIQPENTGRVVGTGYYQYGEVIYLLAEPYHGYEFHHWEDDSEDNPRSITVTGNARYKAFFGSKIYTITATAYPSNGGTVTGFGNFEYGTSCTLIATANDGYSFTNWTENGVVVNSNASYTFTVNDDRNLVANFTPIQQFTITARSNNDEWGTVSGGGLYNAGVNCSLHAIPANGCRFENWKKNGVVVSDEPDFTFEVTGNATYIAFFSKMPTTIYFIETKVNPADAGTVTGGGQHEAGSTVELTATANQGYSFSHWQDDNTDNPREITVTGNATYIAFFVPLQYEITTRVEPEESGSVSGAGTYDYGSTVALTATAKPGYTFDHWDDGNTDNPRAVIVTGDMEFVAIFKEIPCIENLQEIVAKKHTDEKGTYVLILVYPNPNDEEYEYQWQFSTDSLYFSDLHEGTYNKQYYYKGGRLTEGFYKVRVTKGDCSAETEPYHVTYSGNTIRIYPNPLRRGNNITVVNDDDGPAQLTIYSTDGRQLYTQTITGNQANIGVNLPQGVYVAYLINKDGYTKVGKLIIQ